MLPLNLSDKPFLSRQGEGPTAGHTAWFMRFSGCNLRCSWCDTKYTWKEAGAYRVDSQDVVRQILSGPQYENLVITGGEPLLGNVQPVIEEFLRDNLVTLHTHNHSAKLPHVEIETNGTIVPNKSLLGLIDQWNVSIKLSNSGLSSEMRIVDKAIEAFVRLHANFKFVVSSEDDLAEILDLQQLFEIPSELIYLMPEGITVGAQQISASSVIDACIKYNFKLTPRMHIFYGAQ